MFKNLIQVYCMLVCLVSTIIMMITIGIMLHNVTEYIFTEYKYMSELNKFSSNAKYIDYKINGGKYYDYHSKSSATDNKQSWNDQKPELIEEARVAERTDYIGNIKGKAIGALINCFTWLITSLVFFIIHWKMYKRDKQADLTK